MSRIARVQRGPSEAARCASTRDTRALCRPYLLLALNRDVHDVSLPTDQQECKVGRFQRVCETLEGCEIVDRLTIEFEHDVARLETGGFCQTAFFNVRHHHPAGNSQIHLPGQRRGYIVEDDAGEGMSRGS